MEIAKVLGQKRIGLHTKKERMKLDHLRKFAELSQLERLVTCYNQWAEYNWKYFHGVLSPVMIWIGITPYGRAQGYFQPIEDSPGVIVLHQSLGTPATLQHEMMHQAQHQLSLQRIFPGMGGKSDPSKPDWHNCESWAILCDWCDRIDGHSDRFYVWWKQTNRSGPCGRKKEKRYHDLAGKMYWEDELPKHTFRELSTWRSRCLIVP